MSEAAPLHKFVAHADVEEHLRAGWMMTAALCGTHHGVHAMHMIRLCDCPPAKVDAALADSRRNAVERGLTVVANMHKGSGDAELIAWAKANGLFVLIDRRSPWGNPFKERRGGTRAEVPG
jgi:hypothetical protein